MSALPLLGSKRRIPKWSRLALGAVLSVLLLGSLFGQQPLPEPSGYINDYAGVLDQRIRASLEALAQDLQAKTGAEVAVAVLQSLGGESLEDYTNRVAEHWGVGDQADRGVLLLLAIEWIVYHRRLGLSTLLRSTPRPFRFQWRGLQNS